MSIVPFPVRVSAPAPRARDDAAAPAHPDVLPAYAELHCLSNFSFLRGASYAQELFVRARSQGYEALAITDECTLAGIVRALRASKAAGVPLVVGSEIRIEGGPKCVLLVESLAGYVALCDLITRARRRATKGGYRSLREDFDRPLDGLLALWVPDVDPDAGQGQWLASRFPGRTWLAVELHRGPDDDGRLHELLALADTLGLPAVASGDVHMHARGRRGLQDTLTAIRLRVPLAQAGHALFPNGERHLRMRRALAAIYPGALLAESVRIAERCTAFDLKEELRYEYPHEALHGLPPDVRLRQLAHAGIERRWATRRITETHRDIALDQVRAMIDRELAIISQLGYAPFFLTVHDIVRFAKSRGILCQGRGSSANSVVCYALDITELHPGEAHMLFERFVSETRKEPPDIDVDFEHERREEVLQHVFSHYGRDRAALVAVVIHYRARSAVRDVAMALGLPVDQVEEITRGLDRWSSDAPGDDFLAERGFDPQSPLMRRLVELSKLLIGFPRHLSQHPGGFVISQRPLTTLVPVENAAMDDRTVVQWDKDDLEYLSIMKVDCLALGMLTCIRRTFDLLRTQGIELAQQDIPHGDAPTYAMIQRADTIGVFQIESRAQMSMLPRLKPARYYDLVIQVAIVRPGPIQGEMVHPYLRRRCGEEAVVYPTAGVQAVLERTLGVPLFQEQVMEIAMSVGGYSAADADALRRSMAAWRHDGDMEPHRRRLLDGLVAGGCTLEFAENLFNQLKGFGSYGFPESHAASFALLAYQSSYLKCRHPAAFAAALLNSQPMGFYGASQIVQDVRRHGVDVRPVDVRYSDWDCTLEPMQGRARPPRFEGPGPQPAVRLGLCMVKGFDEAAARRIATARAQRPFVDATDLALRAGLDARHMAKLADAGALRALAGHRHRARWEVAGVEPRRALFDDVPASTEAPVVIPPPDARESVQADYAMLGLSLDHHPIALLRPKLRTRRHRTSKDLPAIPDRRLVTCSGLVTLRQRPDTASGITFVTLEDEFGLINVVVRRELAERQRRELVESRLLAVRGRLESRDGVIHLLAHRLEVLDDLLGPLRLGSRDFH
ncbi:error-prone DNA polymerase [Lysobacter humi (ex Lee et al. 2017)]